MRTNYTKLNLSKDSIKCIPKKLSPITIDFEPIREGAYSQQIIKEQHRHKQHTEKLLIPAFAPFEPKPHPIPKRNTACEFTFPISPSLLLLCRQLFSFSHFLDEHINFSDFWEKQLIKRYLGFEK